MTRDGVVPKQENCYFEIKYCGGKALSKEYEISKRLQKYLIEIIKKSQKDNEKNKVKIDTNLECNVPEKDIHKIAGPFIDEWVYETFCNEKEKDDSIIKNVISKESSSLEDVYVLLDVEGEQFEVLIDVKSAALAKGKNAGKGSNLTSFRKIRPFYVNNPKALFFILSIEHKNLVIKEKCHGFELIDCNIFDLKYVVENELMLNTAMGDQFQISNSMMVTQIERTTEDFIELIDNMFIKKYGDNKLQDIIEEGKELEKIEEMSFIVFEIIQEKEPISKRNIISYLKKRKDVTDIEKYLDKAMKLLRQKSIIDIQNRRDYIVFKDIED